MNPRSVLLLIAILLLRLTAFSQSPEQLWKNTWDNYDYAIIKTGFSSDSKYYAIGNRNGAVTIYESATGNIYHSYSLHDKYVFCVVFQPGGTLIASGDRDGNLAVYDYISQTKKYSFAAHAQAITSMSFNHDGSLLITGSRDNSVKVWDVATGKLLHEIDDITGNIICVRLTADNKTIIMGTRAINYGLRIYDVSSGKELRKLPSANVQNFDLSPDGTYIAAANLERKLTVWNLRQYKIAYQLTGHNRVLNDVAFSPDGKFLASTSNDNTLIIWNLEQKKKIASLEGKRDMQGVVWSPNGRYLAFMNDDGSLIMSDMSIFYAHKK